MQILESNPVKFVIETVKAMGDGWKLRPDLNEGHPDMAFLYQLKLFKGFSPEYVVCKEANILVEEYDAMKYLQGCQEAVLNGFELIVESVRFDSVGLKRAVFSNPNYVEPTIWTKQQLEEMEYETLKKVAKQLDCFNRARDIMIVKVLEKQSQQQKG